MATTICKGCKADFTLSKNLPLRITYGHLSVECPICHFINICKIDKNGKIIFIEEGGN